MSDREQVEHFDRELEAMIRRYRAEYEMCYANLVGTLHMKADELSSEARATREEEA